MLCWAAPSPFFWHTALDATLHLVHVPPAVPWDPWSSVDSSVLLCALQPCSPLQQHRSDERDAGWISAAAVSPHASPPLVPPHAGSSVPQALLFTCPILGDRAPLRHLEWLKRRSVSGRLLSWGQAACLNPVLIPSPSEAGRLPGEWV